MQSFKCNQGALLSLSLVHPAATRIHKLASLRAEVSHPSLNRSVTPITRYVLHISLLEVSGLLTAYTTGLDRYWRRELDRRMHCEV